MARWTVGMTSTLDENGALRDLGDGLALRSARATDLEQMVDLNGRLHAEHDTGPDVQIQAWTRDLFELDHPTFRLDEMTVVEEVATGRIVSTVCTIPQTWAYGDVLLPVGRPELVATEEDHRRRGLVRDQFELLHRRGDGRGELLQFITGIPWYYRQFGYEYAIDLPPTPRLRLPGRPAAPDGDRWSVRPAAPGDVPFLARVDAHPGTGIELRPVRDEATWRLELARRPDGNYGTRIFVVEERTADASEPAGYVVVQNNLWDGHLAVRAFELLPDRSWLGATNAVLAFVRELARQPTPCSGSTPPLGVCPVLPEEHPAFRCARSQLLTRTSGGYGLYVRIADLAAFLRSITPVLEARLAGSPAAGFSGHYRCDLFTDGVELAFEDGRLTLVDRWRPASWDDGVDVAMPRNSFLHLVLGNRSFAELEESIADCEARHDTAWLLTEVLFPAMSFNSWIVG